MTAVTTITVSLWASLAAAAGIALMLRALVRRRAVNPGLAALVAATGAAFGLVVLFPVAAAIARADLARTPAAFLLLVPWGLLAGHAVHRWGRPALGMSACILVVTASPFPTSILSVAVGAISGAVRLEKACAGNLQALSTAFRRYVHAHKAWPSENRWTDELLDYLPYPRAYRCPADVSRAYQYNKPHGNAGPDTPIIQCTHSFVGKCLVLRKDLNVEERLIARQR